MTASYSFAKHLNTLLLHLVCSSRQVASCVVKSSTGMSFLSALECVMHPVLFVVGGFEAFPH